MKVYVVLEDDRGCGPMVVGVYQDKDRAEAVARTSGHYWCVEEDLVLEADCVDVGE